MTDITDENLKLIFVKLIGTNYKEENIYEFVFSYNPNNADGLNWDCFPALSKPKHPHNQYINAVATLTTRLRLDLIIDSAERSMNDATDGIIALAFENIWGYEKYPNNRLKFFFGETANEVTNKLIDRDLKIEFVENLVK